VTSVFSIGVAHGQALVVSVVVVVVIFLAATVTDVAIQILSTTCVTAYINKCPSTRASQCAAAKRPEREEKFRENS
jgi:hypothetical protein